jgi:hypothetical protein
MPVLRVIGGKIALESELGGIENENVISIGDFVDGRGVMGVVWLRF